EKTHTNSQIYGENIAIKSKDLSVKGGNIEADKVNIEAKNLHIESMQDKANSNRDKILNALGHEFGHYSKEDDIDKSQDISNYTGDLLENRTKGMVAKEATEDTLAAIRNNKNVITGEEGKKINDMGEFIRLANQLKEDIENLGEAYEK
ncbi:MAG: hemagglutinin repeat-containing protein, partial [Fusobacterium sp.]|nr:hemagglutinin repeat-containing protein [Fusobacterium sp.]